MLVKMKIAEDQRDGVLVLVYECYSLVIAMGPCSHRCYFDTNWRKRFKLGARTVDIDEKAFDSAMGEAQAHRAFGESVMAIKEKVQEAMA